MKKCRQGRAAVRPNEIECLGEGGFAGLPGIDMSRGLVESPGVMTLPSEQQCREEAEINDGAYGHSPKAAGSASFASSGRVARRRRPSRLNPQCVPDAAEA